MVRMNNCCLASSWVRGTGAGACGNADAEACGNADIDARGDGVFRCLAFPLENDELEENSGLALDLLRSQRLQVLMCSGPMGN